MKTQTPDPDEDLEDVPEWLGVDDKLDEILYCQDFLRRHPMKCILGRLFTVDGPVEDEEEIKAMIFSEILDYVTEPQSHRAGVPSIPLQTGEGRRGSP